MKTNKMSVRFPSRILCAVAVFGGTLACSANVDQGTEISTESLRLWEEEAFPGRVGTPGKATIQTENGPVEIEYQMIDGLAVVDGDMILFQEGDETSVSNDAVRPQGVGLSPGGDAGHPSVWPNGVVPYAGAISGQSRIKDAIAHWESKTGLTFRKKTSEDTSYVSFDSVAKGCSSDIGMLKNRVTHVRLGPACAGGTVIHEIGHAIGLFHEQTRSDRDKYVTIKWNNIQKDMVGNFKTRSYGRDYGTYDYDSIMHYASWTWSIGDDKPTIVKKNGDRIEPQRKGLTSKDIAAVKAMYAKQL